MIPPFIPMELTLSHSVRRAVMPRIAHGRTHESAATGRNPYFP